MKPFRRIRGKPCWCILAASDGEHNFFTGRPGLWPAGSWTHGSECLARQGWVDEAERQILAAVDELVPDAVLRGILEGLVR